MTSGADAVSTDEPTPEKAGLWEDFVDIFYTPSTVFARRSDGQWGKALLFLVLGGTILFLLTKNAMAPIMDAEFNARSAEMLRKNPNITAEQLASGRGFFESFGAVFFAVGLTLSVVFVGFAVWLVGKLFDARESVAAALMIATYSEVPRVVQVLTNAAQGLFLSPDSLTSVNSVSLGLARFLAPDTNETAMALASRVDVYTIWITVLIAIGVHVVGKIPKQQAAVVAGVVWLVGAVPAVIGALRG